MSASATALQPRPQRVAFVSTLRSRLLLLVLLAMLPALALMLQSGLAQRRLAAGAVQASVLRLGRLAAHDEERQIAQIRELMLTLADVPAVLGDDPVACQQQLERFRARYQRYANIAVADLNGDLRCSALASSGTPNIADRPYFQQALTTRAFAVSTYQIGRVSKKPGLSFALPLLDESGRVQAVLITSLNLEWLGQMGTAANLPSGSVFLMFDREGTLLARSPDGSAESVGTPVAEAVRLSALARSDGLVTAADADGITRLYGSVPLGGTAANSVFVSVGVPTTITVGAVDRLLVRSMLGLVAVTLAALLAAWLLGDVFVVRQVRLLTRAARRLAAGDLSARTGLTSGPVELLGLGQTFDQMAVSLEQRDTLLRAAEARYRSLVEQIPMVTYTAQLDDQRSLRYISPQIERMLGFTPAAWLKQPGYWTMQIHSDDRERVLAEVARSRTTGARLSLEYRLLAQDGRAVWVYDDTIVTQDSAQARPYFQGILQDITARKQSEEAALARAAAEEANQAKSAFLARMSHELRTPLNAVLGFAQLLEFGTLDELQRDSVGQILKAGRHLLVLINEVLDIARIESGRLTLSIEPVAIDEICQETLDLVTPLAAARNISLVRLPSTSAGWHVLADRQRLKQVLLNLLANAVKYNHEQGSVTIDIVEQAEDCRIEVRDTGPGIPEHDLPKLFQPFERLGAADRGIEGSGLGLMLCKHLTEAMGGRLGVESVVDIGSTFWIELPKADGGLPKPAADAQDGNTEFVPAAQRRTVLYIEDNLSNVRLIERILHRQPGIRLLTAMQGHLGLELAREHRPDLILLDMNLPDIQGDMVIEALCADARTVSIPVVVISADATPKQIARMRAAGADAYLTKPLDIRQFIAVLDQTLGGQT